jgi:hypothetical protein
VKPPSDRKRRVPFASAIVVTGLLVVACGSDDSSQPNSSATSSAPSTALPTSSTAAPTTAAPTTATPTTDAPTTTVSGVVIDAFEPDCVERGPSRPLPALDTSGLDTFGPLGAEPVVQVLLPRVIVDDVSDWVRVEALAVPGGLLLKLRPYNGPPDATMLTVVDSDGVVRWVRCLEGPGPLVRAAPDGGDDGGMMALTWGTYDSNGVASSQIELWSLADGTLARTWDDVLADAGLPPVDDADLGFLYTETPDQLLVATSADRAATVDDRLYLVDPRDGGVEVLALPPGLIGIPLDQVQLSALPDGRLVHLGVANGLNEGRLLAVQDGDGWSTDPADLDAARPAYANFMYGEGRQVLAAFDGTGDLLWRRDDLLAVPAEGFSLALSDGVVLARVCTEPPSDDGMDFCPGPKMVAVDAMTGRTLWERKQWWSASVVADGRAFLNGPYDGTGLGGPVPWEIVDLRSGERVGQRTWTEPWRFSIGCCDEPARVAWNGGVVVSSNEDTLELWYPEARTTPLVVVDLAVD